MSRWAVRKGYRETPFASAESDVIRRRKETPRRRRLQPGEEEKLLSVARPHLQRLIIAALETCCRQGELLSLQRCDVRLERGEITLKAEKTKTREHRTIPISQRLRAVLEMVRTGPDGKEFPPTAFVFGNEVGERLLKIKRAWQTTVLKAHGHQPVWIHKPKLGSDEPCGPRLSPESQATYKAINLHFHDLRHEAGSRLLEAGWPVHHVQHMLGHANLSQTSTYLNPTSIGLLESMRKLDAERAACKLVASDPASGSRPDGKAEAPVADNPLVH
jgi:integrase